jgi:glycosyltransferase involved in cell wall biosynthesis
MYNLAIVKSRAIKPSETFVMQHATHLANVRIFAESFPVRVHTPPFDSAAILAPPTQSFLTRAINTPLGAYIADPFVHRARTATYMKIFREHRINVILAEFGPSGVNVLSAANTLGIPVICNFHGYDAFDRRALKLYSAQYKKLFHSAVGLIAVSQEMQKQLVALGAPQEKVVVWNYGVDTEFFHPAPSPPSRSPFTFLSVGRLVEKKGTIYSLQAFADFHKKQPNSVYNIVGSGPREHVLRQYVRNQNLQDSVHFLGALSHIQVREVLRQSHVLLHHAVEGRYGDREGTPLVIQEAMACGVPVIGTRHAGIVHEIDDGVSGYLIHEKDVQAMTSCMEKLYADEIHWQAVSRAARAKILSQFSSSAQMQILDTIISSLCKAVA